MLERHSVAEIYKNYDKEVAYAQSYKQNNPGKQKRFLIAEGTLGKGTCDFVGHLIQNHIYLIPAGLVGGSSLVDKEYNPADKNQKGKNSNNGRGNAPEGIDDGSYDSAKEDSASVLNACKNCRGERKNSKGNDRRKINIAYSQKAHFSEESHIGLTDCSHNVSELCELGAREPGHQNIDKAQKCINRQHGCQNRKNCLNHVVLQ